MSEADLALARIDAILSEIERLDRETKGQFRQASDREAYDLARRIERKMAKNRRVREPA
jgi:hypothetical protein